MTLDKNITSVKARINQAKLNAAAIDHSITLLAVSKTRSAENVRQAYEFGLKAFGENYLQEALDKQQTLSDLPIEWHFIGPIQSNKTQDIAKNFQWVHTIEREKIARRLNDAAENSLNVCIQVNISEEASKSGCTIADLPQLAAFIETQDKLCLRGLMAIPTATTDQTKQRQAFSKLRQLFIELKTNHPHIDTLSMGMSGDLEAAIAEGSSIVRIGTDIFGPRISS